MGKTVIKAIKEIRGVMRARVAGAANLSSGDLLPGFKQRVGAMRGASHLARGPSRALWAEREARRKSGQVHRQAVWRVPRAPSHAPHPP